MTKSSLIQRDHIVAILCKLLGEEGVPTSVVAKTVNELDYALPLTDCGVTIVQELDGGVRVDSARKTEGDRVYLRPRFLPELYQFPLTT